MATPTASPIVKDLVKAGIIPENCYNWELRLLAGSVAVVMQEIFVSQEQMEVIAQVLKDHPEAVETHTLIRHLEKGTPTERDPMVLDITCLGQMYKQKFAKPKDAPIE